jgi:hypothetical protein
MNTMSFTPLLLALLLLAPAIQVRAQGAIVPAPLGLLRLQQNSRPGQASTLAPHKFAVDALAAGDAPGVTKARKSNLDVLILESGKAWSQSLRGSPHEVSFVSFHLHASHTTIVDIGGARLGLTASPVGGDLQLMFDDSTIGALQWKSLNFHVRAGSFGGKNLAALPTLTVRLDPASSTWDLFSDGRLLADSLPMITSNKGQRQFIVRAGAEGAWITGLVMADENPLYEDANDNGIDDVFERQKRSGGLLLKNAAAAERSQLASEWSKAQLINPPPVLYTTHLLPDKGSR